MPTGKTRPEPRLLIGGLAAGLLLLSACSSTGGGRYSQRHDSAPDDNIDVSMIADATPRVEPRSRYGNPASYVVRGRRYHTLDSSEGYRERGIASWYGTKFHGHRTSSGETYDMYKMTAAHKTLPLPTYARVTNLRNGKSVVVKINDRGPFHENRLIDLSWAAAKRLGILGKGTGLVEVEALTPGKQRAREVRVNTPPAPLPAAATPAPSAPRNAAEPALYLQVGAFLSRSNAERLKRRLSATAAGAQLHISEGMSNRQRVYRVRIGPLDSVERADGLARTLLEHGVESPRVVID